MRISFSTHGDERLQQRTLLTQHNLKYLVENKCFVYIGISQDFKAKFYLLYSITSNQYFVMLLGINNTVISIIPASIFYNKYLITDKHKTSAKGKALSIFFSFTYQGTYGEIKYTHKELLDYSHNIYDLTSDLEFFKEKIKLIAMKNNVEIDDILDVTVTNSNNTKRVKYDCMSIFDEEKWMMFMDEHRDNFDYIGEMYDE